MKLGWLLSISAILSEINVMHAMYVQSSKMIVHLG